MNKVILLILFLILFCFTPDAWAVVSNASIEDEDCSDISDWADSDEGDAISSQVTFDGKSCFKFDSPTTGGGQQAKRDKDVGTVGAHYVVSIKVYCDAIGTIPNNDELRIQVRHTDVALTVGFASDGLFVYDGAAWNEVGADLVVQDTWQEWTFDVTIAGVGGADTTCDVYLDEVSKASDVDCSQTGSYTNGETFLRQRSTTTANRLSYVDWFKVGDDFEVGQFIFISRADVKGYDRVTVN